MDLHSFLRKYGYSPDDFDKTGLVWDELLAIKRDHEAHLRELENVGRSLTNDIISTECVHSVKYRIKDSEHLIEKIIRKKINDPTFNCDVSNYFSKVTDLVGVRALHLFKADWKVIHNCVMSKWDTQGQPIAKYRKGDAEDLIREYEANGCLTEEHKFGYRSIHYVIENRFYKRSTLVEIQVRTIFEEGWSEIDHFVRYPYDQDNPILLPYLTIFNRLAGSADEMASYLLHLRKVVAQYEDEIEQEKNRIKALEDQIEKLKIEPSEKESLKENVSSFIIPANNLFRSNRFFEQYLAAVVESVSRKEALKSAFVGFTPRSKALADAIKDPSMASPYLQKVFDIGEPSESDEAG